MATTALFVEILVIGAIAELWIGTLLLSFVSREQLDHVFGSVSTIRDAFPLLAVLTLALTYGLGWIFNFAAERMFRLFGQQKYRDEPFQTQPYETVRVLVLQGASDALIHELRMDRHIVRIARGSFLNFVLMIPALLLNYDRIDTGVLVALVVACVAISVLSFFQWLTRYRSYYRTVARAFQVIVSERAKTT